MKSFRLLLLLIFSALLLACPVVTGNDRDSLESETRSENTPEPVYNTWTFMVYSSADNDLESALLLDIQEMIQGYRKNVNIVVLIDRAQGYSIDYTTFGEDFTDTRLYRITADGPVRLSGGEYFPEITMNSKYEANMGDPVTLKKFIEFAKGTYPASRYALIIESHGGGARGFSDLLRPLSREISVDISSGYDWLYTAEITDYLNSSHSVDLLGFDACLMGNIETAYQFRPGNGGFNARVFVASAPNEHEYGWYYDQIFQRIDEGTDNGSNDTTVGGKEKLYSPHSMTAVELGSIIIEEHQDALAGTTKVSESLACFDLSRIEAVKNSIDTLSGLLALENEKADFETIRGSLTKVPAMHYFDNEKKINWEKTPYFDVHDLCVRIANSDLFSTIIRKQSQESADKAAAAVLYSFGGKSYKGFMNGQNGLSIFCPDGDRIYKGWDGKYYPLFKLQNWYSPLDTVKAAGIHYGKLSWCIDNGISGDGQVDNWFELLDYWFDDKSVDKGCGYNGYIY